MNGNGHQNPFRDNVVQDAWQSPADVAEIHADVFRACLTGIESAARGIPDSLVIYGPAGSGKTHLLSRLQRHLADTATAAPDRVLHCVFVFVRLQTSPTLLWQHVRKRLANDLMRRDQGITQLQRLIAHQMGLSEGVSPRAKVMELRVLSEADHEPLVAHLSRLSESLSLPRDLCVVLEHLVCGRYVRDASAWLAGDSLPEAVLTQLGLGPDVFEDREVSASEIVTALCRLAGETLPIVFCFDQVEALQRGLDDRDAFYRFGRTVADICDADPNVFATTCLQSSYLDLFRSCIRGSDRDRMCRREIVMSTLTRPQVANLISSRLASLSELAQNGNQLRDRLVRSVYSELSSESDWVPRRVLACAARAFDEQQLGLPQPDANPEDGLRDAFDARRLEALRSSTPADTERIILQGLEVIGTLREIQGTIPNPKTADFLIDGEQKIAVEICNEADARSLGPRLKRILAKTPRADGARTLILRDPRLPIAKTATKTREHLATLRAKGAAYLEPSIEALAALAALSALLADAKSGDLTQENGSSISEGGVVEWLRSLGRDLALEPVNELVDELIGPILSPVDPIADDLAELLSRKRIVEAAFAGATLDVPIHRLVELARSSPERFLVLEGPPAVVMDVAGIAASAEVPS